MSRRWIACDLGRFAIHTTRKRLLSIPNVRPFVVQNLGKYERQVWAGAEFGDGNGKQAAERQRAYVEFILKLANATPINGYTWLHGVKGGRMVHVGAVDAPVSVGDVTQIAAEFKRAIGTGKDAPKTNGVDVLGWDFAFELNEVAKQQAAAANIQMRFLRIPRDVMDKRAVEQGDIHFFELAALSVEVEDEQAQRVPEADGFRHSARRRAGRRAQGGQALVAVDRLLGGGLGQQGRHVPQRVADLPHAQGQVARSWRSRTPTRKRASTRSSSR